MQMNCARFDNENTLQPILQRKCIGKDFNLCSAILQHTGSWIIVHGANSEDRTHYSVLICNPLQTITILQGTTNVRIFF